MPTHAGHGAQSTLGTQGKEGGARLAAGECVAVFELAPWVGSSTFPCFFLIVLQIRGKLLGSYIGIILRRQPHLTS